MLRKFTSLDKIYVQHRFDAIDLSGTPAEAPSTSSYEMRYYRSPFKSWLKGLDALAIAVRAIPRIQNTDHVYLTIYHDRYFHDSQHRPFSLDHRDLMSDWLRVTVSKSMPPEGNNPISRYSGRGFNDTLGDALQNVICNHPYLVDCATKALARIRTCTTTTAREQIHENTTRWIKAFGPSNYVKYAKIMLDVKNFVVAALPDDPRVQLLELIVRKEHGGF
jgi:hypothetical protein